MLYGNSTRHLRSMANACADSSLGSNTLSLDLSTDWDNSTVIFNETPKPDAAPFLNKGALWYYQPDDILYTGWVGDSAVYLPDIASPPRLSLWAFKPDQKGSGSWSLTIGPDSDKWRGIAMPRQASVAQSGELGFALGGEYPGADGILSLTEFNLDTRESTNITSPLAYGIPIEQGNLQFVDKWGPKGLLLALNGAHKDGPWWDANSVPVYDIAAHQWYNQTTNGPSPGSAVDSCVAGIASNNNTFEIFVYSGSVGYGDVYQKRNEIHILTLPAFHWIELPYKAVHPRAGHSCDPVGGGQILIVGGTDPTVDETETVGLDQMTEPDVFKQGLAVFNMSSLEWQDHYSASPPNYEQADEVKQYYMQTGRYVYLHLPPSNANQLVCQILRKHFAS